MESQSADQSFSSSGSSLSVNTFPYGRSDVENCASNLQLFNSTTTTNTNTNKNNRTLSRIFQGRKLSSSSSSSSSSSRRITRNARLLAVASLAVSSLCLLFVVFFGVCFFIYGGDASPFALLSRRGGETQVCVPCVQISPDPFLGGTGSSSASVAKMWSQLDVRYDNDDDEMERGEEEGERREEEEEGRKESGAICCASTPTQYAVLFKLILQRQQEVKKFADSLDTPRGLALGQVMGDSTPPSVAAHLVFKPPSQRTPATSQEKGEDIHRQEHWKSPEESPLSFVQNGLKFHNNRIFVQTPGLYFIYCQTLFNPSYPTSPHDVIASAYVRRYSVLRPAAPDFLLKTRHTRHDVSRDRHSSYVGGAFRLYRGDSLYVQVSRPELLSHDDVASFFGLFRLGP